MRHAEKGYALSYLVLVFTVATILILISATWRANRLRQSHGAYVDATALSLAQGGVEAATSAVKRGGLPAARPLGDSVELTSARGELSVEARRVGERIEVLSCAEVTPFRPHVRPSRRCVEATLEAGPEARILEWNEP